MRCEPLSLFLDDIIEAIRRIHSSIDGLIAKDFKHDLKTRIADIRNREIIGAAAGNMPEEIKSQSVGTRWRQIAGVRNILIHEYSGISTRIVWDIVQIKLKPLEQTCRKLLE